jgi:ascorbate-specific PTS system EIIC-type component UlaA
MESSQESGTLKAALNILRNTPVSDTDLVSVIFVTAMIPIASCFSRLTRDCFDNSLSIESL